MFTKWRPNSYFTMTKKHSPQSWNLAVGHQNGIKKKKKKSHSTSLLLGWVGKETQQEIKGITLGEKENHKV